MVKARVLRTLSRKAKIERELSYVVSNNSCRSLNMSCDGVDDEDLKLLAMFFQEQVKLMNMKLDKLESQPRSKLSTLKKYTIDDSYYEDITSRKVETQLKSRSSKSSSSFSFTWKSNWGNDKATSKSKEDVKPKGSDAIHKEIVGSSGDEMLPLEESSGDEMPPLEECSNANIEEHVHGDLLFSSHALSNKTKEEGIKIQHGIPHGLLPSSDDWRTNHFEEGGNDMNLIAFISNIESSTKIEPIQVFWRVRRAQNMPKRCGKLFVDLSTGT